jgi:hypothetical protein
MEPYAAIMLSLDAGDCRGMRAHPANATAPFSALYDASSVFPMRRTNSVICCKSATTSAVLDFADYNVYGCGSANRLAVMNDV